jgi:hypothetical protein
MLGLCGAGQGQLDAIGARAFGFFVTTENGSHPGNRIISGGGDDGIPTADYSIERLASIRGIPYSMSNLVWQINSFSFPTLGS